jgi:class 3 adenylate cyclase/tetratricopeptide (TPR) repeat protein
LSIIAYPLYGKCCGPMRYVFGGYSLDTECYELRHAGVRIPLRPKVFQLLAYLLIHRDRVVLKDELVEHMWPNQFIGDTALKSCMMTARKAVGDAGRTQRVIQTLHGHGYRFVAAVTIEDQTPPARVTLAGLSTASAPLKSAHETVLGPPVPPPTPLQALEWEYKQVTVLCCALAHATTLATRLGPETMHALIQEVLALVQRTVQHCEGTITQYLGDSFMALFGAPLTHEDHARRAVLAALELQQCLRAYRSVAALPKGVSLAAGIGLHTGPIVVGPLASEGQRLYTAVGETMSLASRLQSLAAPGAVLISEATYQLVCDEIQSETCGTIKGAETTAPVAVYSVQGITRRRSGVPGRRARGLSQFVGPTQELAVLHEHLAYTTQGQGQVVGIVGEPEIGKSRLLNEFAVPVSAPVSPGGPAGMEALRRAPPPRFRRPQHFVGRDAELAQLTQWWTTARRGTRQVGVIAGEPGIGKTALVEAFLAQVAAAGECRVGHGQCIEPYGPGEPYLPVLEALGRLGWEPDGSGLVSVLRQYAPSWLVQMPALVPPAERAALQHTVGHPVQTRMLRELTEALDALTTERPLVLVLEDLHWSDRATLEWLAYSARRPDRARLLLLGTYRPVDAMVQAHPLRAVLTELQQHGQCVELALDYLSEAEVMAYLRQRFGGTRLAADLARVLHQRTRGNPLFLIAIVDEIVRQQVVREGPDGWDMRGGVETIPVIIPATLRALLEHQLAHCSPEAQTLLAAASVAGVEFAAATVAAGLERAEEEIEAQCATLAHQGQFLQARGRAEWPDGTVTAWYSFIHAVYQEVLYQRIPAGRQSRWHARIGARLAQGFGAQAGDLAAALAQHFVRGRMMSQAVPYLRQAGETAMLRSAHREAVGYFEQALSAIRHLPDSRDTREQAIDLCFDLRDALHPLGEHGRILDYLRQTEPLAEALGDRRRLGQLAVYMTACLRLMGDPDGSLAAAKRALALAEILGDVGLRVVANACLGELYLYTLNDYRRGTEAFSKNVEILHGPLLRERFGSALVQSVNSRACLAVCLAELGAFAEGLVHGEEALRLAEAVEHPYSLAQACATVGHFYLRQGALPQALRVLERGLVLSDTVHLPVTIHRCTVLLGAAYALSGRVPEALPLLERALEQIVTMKATTLYPLYAVWVAEGYVLAGRVAQARPLGQRALEVARAQKQPGYQAYALRLMGEIGGQDEASDVEVAVTHYRQALALAEALGMRPLQAHCHLGLGSLYGKLGRREQVRAELSTARELYGAMEMTFWLPQAAAVLAQVAGR